MQIFLTCDFKYTHTHRNTGVCPTWYETDVRQLAFQFVCAGIKNVYVSLQPAQQTYVSKQTIDLMLQQTTQEQKQMLCLALVTEILTFLQFNAWTVC